MTELGKHLDSMTIRAVSPDTHVRALVKGRGMPTISFDEPEIFEDYQKDPESLCTQVSAVIERAMVGVGKGRRQMVEQYTELEVTDDPDWDAERRRFNEALDNIRVDISSGSDLVRVETVGLHRWRVRVRPGAIGSMTASQFCAAVNSGVQEAYSQFLVSMRRAKEKAFGKPA